MRPSAIAKKRVILMADDDPDDQELVREAMSEAQPNCVVRFVEDGQDLLNYLEHRGPPDLVILDLNMPRMDGREALRLLRTDERFTAVPVIVVTTSGRKDEVDRAYELGANGFLRKSTSYRDLVRNFQRIAEYWFWTVELPV